MTSRPATPRALAVLTTGLATTAYYALPDLVPSRTARSWLKAGVTAVSLVAAVPELRDAKAEVRGVRAAAAEAEPPVTFAAMRPQAKAVLLASGTAALAVSTRGLVALERRAFRYGEARAAAGKRLPHTGPALVYGVLAAALWFVPTPSDAPAD